MSGPVVRMLGYCAFTRIPRVTCRMCRGDRTTQVWDHVPFINKFGQEELSMFPQVIGRVKCRACNGYGFHWFDACGIGGDVCLSAERFAEVKAIEAMCDEALPW